MFVDPFAGDPPISDEEKALEYECKPGVDYFAEFYAIHPQWVVPPAKYLDGDHPSNAAFFDIAGPREFRTTVKDPVTKKNVRQTKGMGYERYFVAVDPAGSICPMIVSTIGPDRQHPSGDDGLQTAARTVAIKSQRGWLVVERYPDCWNAFSGKVGQDYAAWCMAVSKYRKAKHAAHQKQEQEEWMADRKREGLEQAKAQGEIMADAFRAGLDKEKSKGGRPPKTSQE